MEQRAGHPLRDARAVVSSGASSVSRIASPRRSQYFQCEDPFLWRDARGNYHVLFHHGDARTKEDLGGHGFSSDGETWALSHTNAYGNNFTTSDDGVARRFKRPQRPQLLLDNDGAPRVLILGVAGDFLHSEEAGQCNPPSAGPGCDRSWTLGAPVR